MPVQADASGDSDLLSLLKKYVRERYKKPGEAYLGLVHRLDRPVGGVMAFAKTSKAADRLAAQFMGGSAPRLPVISINGVGEGDDCGVKPFSEKSQQLLDQLRIVGALF